MRKVLQDEKATLAMKEKKQRGSLLKKRKEDRLHHLTLFLLPINHSNMVSIVLQKNVYEDNQDPGKEGEGGGGREH